MALKFCRFLPIYRVGHTPNFSRWTPGAEHRGETGMSRWAHSRQAVFAVAGWTGRGALFGVAAAGIIVAGALLQVAAAWVID